MFSSLSNANILKLQHPLVIVSRACLKPENKYSVVILRILKYFMGTNE